MGVEDIPRATTEYRCAVQPQQRAAKAKAHVADEKNAQESRQCGPQARRPMMNAEDRIGGSGDPVLERRLLEILDPVEPRRDPVAAGRHLARNFRVSAFVRVHQTTILEIGEPNRGEDEQQDDGSAAGQRGRRGGDSRSGGRGHRDGRDFTAFRKLRAIHTSLAAAPVIRYHASMSTPRGRARCTLCRSAANCRRVLRGIRSST